MAVINPPNPIKTPKAPTEGPNDENPPMVMSREIMTNEKMRFTNDCRYINLSKNPQKTPKPSTFVNQNTKNVFQNPQKQSKCEISPPKSPPSHRRTKGREADDGDEERDDVSQENEDIHVGCCPEVGFLGGFWWGLVGFWWGLVGFVGYFRVREVGAFIGGEKFLCLRYGSGS